MNPAIKKPLLAGILGLGLGVAFGYFLDVERVHITLLMAVGFGVAAWIFTYLLLKITNSSN